MGAELQVLGQIGLVVDGRPTALGGNRQRAILGYLALHAGRTVAVDAIVDDVWGEDPPATVVKSLSTLVSRLRPILAVAGIELLHDGSGYRLEVPEDGLDLQRFRSHVRAARIAELGGDIVTAKTHLRAALGTWGGPAFDRLDAPFVRPAATALEDERTAAADGLVRALLRVGDHAGAIRLLEELVEASPYREDRWARLIDGHLQAGDRAEASAVYERAVKVLDHDLGLVPGQQLIDAARRIDLVDPVTAVASPARSRTVGRKKELDYLEAAAQDAVAGDRRVLAVIGEAGVGKSHLLRALAERLGERGLPVLLGRCDPLGANVLGPLLQAVLHAEQLGVLPEIPFERFPALAAALGGASWSDRQATTDRIDAGDLHRRRILVELADLAQLLGRDHPLIIGVEDLHWADPFTLTMLHHLANLEATATTCFIATARPHELEVSRAGELLAILSSTLPVDRVHLEPLTGPEVRELVAGTLPESARVPEVFDTIQRGSGGNPLYALHLAHHVADRGVSALEGPLPRDTLDLFEARLCTVSDATRELIAVAATLGAEFSLDVLARVFEEPLIPLNKAIHEAARAGLIEAVDHASGRYRFVHGLIRRAAYEAVAEPTLQAELHRTVAVVLGYGRDAATLEIAEHLWRARSVVDHDEVATAILEATQPAITFGAVVAAGDLLRQGLRLEASPACMAELNVRLGEVLLSQGEASEGRALLAAGRRLALAADRWDLAADAVLALRRLGIAPTIEAAEEIAAHADEVLGAELDDGRRARLLLYRADLLVNVDVHGASADLDAAEALTRDDQLALRRRIAWVRLRVREAMGHDPHEVGQAAGTLLAEAEAVDDMVGAAHLANVVQRCRLRRGDYRACIADADRFAALAAAGGRIPLLHEMRLAAVAARVATEPLQVGEAEVELAMEDSAAAGISSATTWKLLQIWVIRREQCRLAELAPLLYAIPQSTKRPGAAVWLAAFHLEAGDPASAASLLDGLAGAVLQRSPDWTRVAMLSLIADAQVEVGQVEWTDELYDALLPAAGQVAVLAGAAQVLGQVDRYLGRLARLRGDHDRAIGHFDDARRLDVAAGAGLWGAWAAHDEAVARLARDGHGDADTAMALLSSAATTAKRYGSRRLAAAVRAVRAAQPG